MGLVQDVLDVAQLAIGRFMVMVLESHNCRDRSPSKATILAFILWYDMGLLQLGLKLGLEV